SESQQNDKIVVTIDEAGQMSLNEASIQFDELASSVETLKGDRPNVLVTINADETVYHGIVVAVMDELRTIEGARLGIATQRPQPQEVQ
ncbi:MAG: biopolymer transporter ExbD, partial [Symploca sp. SIO2B6]|nr:biopolymer transporter ExbD [Symploca sp. SIO2B6]